ncbi:glycosyl hydrolase [Polaribacter batillariae]|uniref:Endo-1,3-beta-glucanase btgC n=1 Tax=Polaribacter batillariae TaxID=2808900 RepID=A0ABX7SYV7_9FLAO|nr:glycosyl hydrolase family 17 protein [Polaribacter batillariae]QTD38478.1 glycosyl hydrolase [Polaribacter batillariae]
MSYREGHHFSLNYKEGELDKGVDFSKYSLDSLQKLWRETLQQGMHGICFSMYEDGQKPGDTITKEQVERRIKILKPYTQWIRSFSCIEGNEHIPRIAKKHDLKTMVGAWLGNDAEKNEQEIQALIALAKEGCVDIAAVGNEVLYRNDLSLEELLSYIKRVKTAIPDVTVGYVDAYYEFSRHPELVEVSDVILSNCYPFWEGCPIDYSLAHMQSMYKQATHAAQGKKVIITETGWPSQGGSEAAADATDENTIKYFINTQVWSAKDNVEVFYFSSFDESWKVGDEGDVGGYWGLWDKNERLKY